MEWKVFNDNVHGHMEFHPLIVSIIDTPQFQRLRYLKQTGPCYFVYPTALHTRFEHSLGTAFLAGKLMDAMNRKRGFFGEEAEKETLSVQVAGLCHDLGHGPFSHTWERFLMRLPNAKPWKHEDSSVEIFRRILGETVPDRSNVGGDIKILDIFKNYGLEDYISKIEKMITGVKGSIEKKYLYQVIANKTNGIDVDKWEYLMRDSKMTNFAINFDYERMLLFSQILRDNEDKQEVICYRDKDISVVVNMFLSRGLLHDKVYQHRKVKIIEEMLIDAFCLAEKTLKLSATDADSILKLTDHIYQKILYDDFDGNEEMAKAKEILRRLEKRLLYLCIGACETKNKIDVGKLEKIEGEVFERLLQRNGSLQRDMIKIIYTSIDMTKYNKGKNLKEVRVYKSGAEEAVIFDWDKFHSLKPDLKTLSRHELMVLYKGRDFTLYKEHNCDDLLSDIIKDISAE